MAQVELRFVEIEQSLDEEGVVVEEAGNGGVARAIAAQQGAAGGVVQVADDEFRGAARGLGVAGSSSTAPPLAKAEIMRPFQEVRILSSRCGRTRWAARRHQNAACLIEGGLHFGQRLAELARRLFHGVRLVKNVLAGELAVRIARDVGAFENAVAIAEPVRGGLAEQGSDFVDAPDVERAFALEVGVLGSRSRYRHLPPNRSRRRHRSYRAGRNRRWRGQYRRTGCRRSPGRPPGRRSAICAWS